MKRIRLKSWKPGDRLRLAFGNDNGKGVAFVFEPSECLEDDIACVLCGQTGTLREPTDRDLDRISLGSHCAATVRILAWVMDEHPGEGKYDAVVFTNDCVFADHMRKIRTKKSLACGRSTALDKVKE